MLARIANFNPRSPHGERRQSERCGSIAKKFQSTLPARGATQWIARRLTSAPYFNPRSPHGERLAAMQYFAKLIGISIHAPRTGSDQVAEASDRQLSHFNPRSPHGERRYGMMLQTGKTYHFNPRSPHGERLIRERKRVVPKEFQSTLPARGATAGCYPRPDIVAKISIHAPRTGSDRRAHARNRRTPYFNPRSPHGERRAPATSGRPREPFQSTLPARGATI